MKISKVSFVIGILVLVFLAMFAVPKFSFNLLGQTVTWPGLELQNLGLATKLGTFNHGKDLYPSFEVKLAPQLSTDPGSDNNQLLQNDLKLVRLRMDMAQLYDVDLFTRITDGTPSIVLHFPQYYGQPLAESLSQLLVTPGQIKFVENDPNGDAAASPTTLESALIAQIIQGYVEKDSALLASDIQAMTLESRVNLGGEVIRIKVNDDASAKLRAALDRVKNDSNSTKPVIMVVDQQPEFALVDLGVDNEILAAPIYSLFTTSQLSIVSTFPPVFPPLQLAYDSPSTTQIPNIYAPEGHVFLAWMFVVVGVFTLIWLMRRYQPRRLLAYALNLIAFVLLSIFILKIASVALSTGVIIGFMLMYILAAVSLHMFISEPEEAHTFRLQQRDVAIFVFLISALLYMSNIIFGEFQNLLGVVALMSAILVFVYMVPVQIFTEAHIAEFNFKRRKATL